mmetsp:Transcript_23720/g.73499  ORF Transcript_23720/g.73499 Transcript_23720/m.73499 type:complete len:238 (+) Transcript_23720:319-1032(+)
MQHRERNDVRKDQRPQPKSHGEFLAAKANHAVAAVLLAHLVCNLEMLVSLLLHLRKRGDKHGHEQIQEEEVDNHETSEVEERSRDGALLRNDVEAAEVEARANQRREAHSCVRKFRNHLTEKLHSGSDQADDEDAKGYQQHRHVGSRNSQQLHQAPDADEVAEDQRHVREHNEKPRTEEQRRGLGVVDGTVEAWNLVSHRGGPVHVGQSRSAHAVGVPRCDRQAQQDGGEQVLRNFA